MRKLITATQVPSATGLNTSLDMHIQAYQALAEYEPSPETIKIEQTFLIKHARTVNERLASCLWATIRNEIRGMKYGSV